MRKVSVNLDPETEDTLRTECDLLGFEDLDSYLRWLVHNRAAIDSGTDHADLLEAYRERIQHLEDQLEAVESEASTVDADSVLSLDGAVADDEGSTDGDATASASTGPKQAQDDGRDPPAVEGSSAVDAEVTSMHLTPERVSRITEDPVAEDAGVLGDVETERVDEFARRAVARTRKQLDRDVETGLDYRSETGIEDDTVRPGEDVTDLESIDVPGRSDDVVERRQAAVGQALAYLRDCGEARRSDVVDHLYERCPAGYGSEESWWRCVREGLSQVDAVDGGHVWTYTG